MRKVKTITIRSWHIRNINDLPTAYLCSLIVDLQVLFILLGFKVLPCFIFVIFKKLSNVITPIFFINSTFPMFHVILKISIIAIAVLIEVEPLPMFLVLYPISNIQLTFYIVVLSFSMFHPIFKLSLITLFVCINEYTPSVIFAINNTTLI